MNDYRVKYLLKVWEQKGSVLCVQDVYQHQRAERQEGRADGLGVSVYIERVSWVWVYMHVVHELD